MCILFLKIENYRFINEEMGCFFIKECYQWFVDEDLDFDIILLLNESLRLKGYIQDDYVMLIDCGWEIDVDIDLKLEIFLLKFEYV